MLARGATYAGCALRKRLAPKDGCSGDGKLALGAAAHVDSDATDAVDDAPPLAAATPLADEGDASCSDDERLPVATATPVG